MTTLLTSQDSGECVNPVVDVVKTAGLTKRFGKNTVVDNLSFSLPIGSITGFVGPNGAGKTTTIRMLLGLLKPSSGTAVVLGSPIGDPGSYLTEVGALIEAPAFYGSLSGRANLQVLQRLGGLDAGRVDEVLKAVDLTDRAESRASDYSLGMKQRLGIAAALLPDPAVLILDEPTNGLDPAGIRAIRDLLTLLASEGTSVLVSSHLLAEIQSLCDRLVMIREGRLVYEGTLDGLLTAQVSKLALRPEYPSDLESLSNELEDHGVLCEVEDGELVVDNLPGTAARANRIAMNSDIVLVELRPMEATLEDAFFDLDTDEGANQ